MASSGWRLWRGVAAGNGLVRSDIAVVEVFSCNE